MPNRVGPRLIAHAAASCCLLCSFARGSAAADANVGDNDTVVHVRTAAPWLDKTFDGVGGLSAGASTRLLVDYPEQERGWVLDYLFLPQFGASLQILKIEIGGTGDSTAGTEDSHERTRGDVNMTHGYELWFAQVGSVLCMVCFAWCACRVVAL
jgi:hypothetical protein